MGPQKVQGGRFGHAAYGRGGVQQPQHVGAQVGKRHVVEVHLKIGAQVQEVAGDDGAGAGFMVLAQPQMLETVYDVARHQGLLLDFFLPPNGRARRYRIGEGLSGSQGHRVEGAIG